MSKNIMILFSALILGSLGVAYLLFNNEPSSKQYITKEKSAQNAYDSQQLENAPQENNSDEKVIATIGDIKITENQLFSQDALILYDIQQQEFEFKLGRLRKITTDLFLQEKSLENKMSPDEYIKKHIVKNKSLAPNESQIMDFARSQGVEDYAVLKQNPGVLEQMRQFLTMRNEYELVQEEVSKWLKNKPVSYTFNRPKLPVEIPEYQSPAWGPVKAPIVIFKFSDFECTFCSRAGATLLKLKAKYQDKVRIVYKHFPLSIHPNAKLAAQASVCIHQQKPMGFWSFYESMLTKHDKITATLLRNEAKNLNMDLKKYDECLNLPATEATVMQDLDFANQLGLESTPTFFINGEMLKGNVPMEVFEEVIEAHLKKRK